MALTKADIVERIYKEMGLAKKESAEMVDCVFDIIKDTLTKGEKVKISGFGNFSIRDKSKRMGRNPQTGEDLEISSRRVISYRPSQVLKDDITNRYAHRIDDNGHEDTFIEVAESHETPRSLTSFRTGHKEDDD